MKPIRKRKKERSEWRGKYRKGQREKEDLLFLSEILDPAVMLYFKYIIEYDSLGETSYDY